MTNASVPTFWILSHQQCRTEICRSVKVSTLSPTSFPSSFSNNNQSLLSGGASISVPTIPVTASLPSVSAGRGSSAASGGFNELRSSNGSRKARVLYDYDAASSSELSLLADEVSAKSELFPSAKRK